MSNLVLPSQLRKFKVNAQVFSGNHVTYDFLWPFLVEYKHRAFTHEDIRLFYGINDGSLTAFLDSLIKTGEIHEEVTRVTFSEFLDGASQGASPVMSPPPQEPVLEDDDFHLEVSDNTVMDAGRVEVTL